MLKNSPSVLARLHSVERLLDSPDYCLDSYMKMNLKEVVNYGNMFVLVIRTLFEQIQDSNFDNDRFSSLLSAARDSYAGFIDYFRQAFGRQSGQVDRFDLFPGVDIFIDVDFIKQFGFSPSSLNIIEFALSIYRKSFDTWYLNNEFDINDVMYRNLWNDLSYIYNAYRTFMDSHDSLLAFSKQNFPSSGTASEIYNKYSYYFNENKIINFSLPDNRTLKDVNDCVANFIPRKCQR
ncbi:hypothetical protein FACS1894113_5660 [Alphaproteobacteria bacterium]|nr:hypothetical protein FACS1894113_5660 [Alphaproteobacteria bacterium]